ncbi:hypothetical protein JCM15519_35670 [Fundidesulfovibrio butyratiphilus]
MDSTTLRIRSLKGGHHRSGRRFGSEAVEIDARTLSRKGLAALQADPDLSVEIVPEENP